ncbi:MAG: hypothetical protein KJ615_02225 [Bacteroidetes bacterium]|nr:hypothetical protein [Bacteroidota bacterium]
MLQLEQSETFFCRLFAWAAMPCDALSLSKEACRREPVEGSLSKGACRREPAEGSLPKCNRYPCNFLKPKQQLTKSPSMAINDPFLSIGHNTAIGALKSCLLTFPIPEHSHLRMRKDQLCLCKHQKRLGKDYK